MTELIIGFVGAVGSDLEGVEEAFKQELSGVGCSSDRIHISSLMLECPMNADRRYLAEAPHDIRIDGLMTAGDELRHKLNRGDAAALLAIGKIRALREGNTGHKNTPRTNHAYILHSLKHPKEVETLRQVYGTRFLLVAVYMPRRQRQERLVEAITHSNKSFRQSDFEEAAKRLIRRDERERDDLGQNVEDTFPQADVFLDASHGDEVSKQVKRSVEILFGNASRTPTCDEVGLFRAKAASLRSADLSRQVGAVIADDDGEVIAEGCNEVPIAGGGSVWEGRDAGKLADRRDFVVGYDSSAAMRNEMLQQLFQLLSGNNWLSARHTAMPSEELAKLALTEPATEPDGEAKPGILKGALVSDILEFGRMVHAEMSAICAAAKRGLPVKGATLYCTTFPCHMCARHIIAAGIRRVVYIEPYPKSRAKELYRGALSVDGDEADADDNAVRFQPFVGVAPRRFMDFFEMRRKRKMDSGHAIRWNRQSASPRVSEFSTYLHLEGVHLETTLDKRGVELGIIAPPANQQETRDVG